MPSAQRSLVINRPVGDVFTFLADGENAPQWRPGVLDAEHVSGEGVGAIYRQGVKGPGGRRIAADYRVTAFEPNRLIGFQAIAGPIRPHGEFRFETSGAQTTVHFALDVGLTGLQRFFLARAVQSTMDGEMRTLDNLKRMLEA